MNDASTVQKENEAETLLPMRQAREWALQALYQIDIRQASVADLAEIMTSVVDGQPMMSLQEKFLKNTVIGVTERRQECDHQIEKVSPTWKLSRMGVIDRNILRMGCYELVFQRETPEEVVINECVLLAKKFGDENSSRFVNGLLQEIVHQLT